MRILVIDNKDSFVYNLVDYVSSLGTQVKVIGNKFDLKVIEEFRPDGIVISPGPGTPEETGNVIPAIKKYPHIPTLGVCLGHQAIALAFGGKVTRGEKPVHGKASLIYHDRKTIYKGLPSPFLAGRYHSLVAKEPIPKCLEISAYTEDSVIMGLRHKEYPIEGVQFHPESVLTPLGKKIIQNFLDAVKC
ncbi:MAG: anthranilate synthase component II [Candidatus Hydrothermarchaeota archaeon]